jgi:hypothetical protein
LPHHFEARLELAQAFQSRFGTNEFIAIRQDDAVLVLHWHQRFVERAVGPGSCIFLLGMQHVGIDVLTAETFKGGDQVGSHTLRVDVAMQVGCKI